MLRERVLTAIVLLAIVLAVVLVFPGLFLLFIGAAVLAGAWEWSRLAGLRSLPARFTYLLLFLLLQIGSWLLLRRGMDPQAALVASLLWWLLASLMIFTYPRHVRRWGTIGFLSLAGVLVLLPGWLSFVYLRGQDNFAFLILLLLAAVAAADIGAYFAGRRFGRNKLAPRVSPNKTWEGFWGGVAACCILVALAAGSYTAATGNPLSTRNWLELLGFAALLGVMSVVGDLLESMIKRYRDVKDSGNLLPGHGGVLDRIDGITAAAPVYALLVMSIGADLA